MYLDATQTWPLSDILARIEEKWLGSSSDRIKISSMEMNTDCL